MSSPIAERFADLEVEVSRLRTEVATLSRRIGHADLATVVERLAGRVSALDGKRVNAVVTDRAPVAPPRPLADDAVIGDEVVAERVIETDRPPPSSG